MLDLQELEELSKAVHKNAIKAFLRNAAILKDPKATPEMKELAAANVKAISQTAKTPKKDPTRSGVVSRDLSGLKDEISGAEDKVSGIKNEKIKQQLASKANADKNLKAEQAAQREAERNAQREKELLPGSNFTQKELEQHAARQERDPKAPAKEKPSKKLKSPQEQIAAERTRHDSVVTKALDLAHELHQGGEHDHAFRILKAIPRESMPKELKHYDPVYIHYNVSPHTWKALPPEHQEHVKNFHHEVMSGMHNESPDVSTKQLAGKVTGLLKPQKS